MPADYYDLESLFEMELLEMRVHYVRPEQIAGSRNTLDFQLLLPAELGGPMCVEVKAWSSERLHDQLRRSGAEASGIVVLVGAPAVMLFLRMLRAYYGEWVKKGKGKEKDNEHE